jgi:hypothetical protein
MAGLINMYFPWVDYKGMDKLTELTVDRLLPDFKKFVLMYPKVNQRKMEWVINYLEEMDEWVKSQGDEYTKEHSDYLEKISKETMEIVEQTKLRQEIESSEIEYMDERLKHKLKISDVDVGLNKEFTIENATDESEVIARTGADEISEIELDDETYIKHILKKYVTKTSSSNNSFSLTIEFSDEDLKRKTVLMGEEIKLKEKIISNKPAFTQKHTINFDVEKEEAEKLGLPVTSTPSEWVPSFVTYIAASKKRIKNFIFKNKESIFEGLVFNLTARQIYDVELEITVTPTPNDIEIKMNNKSKLTDRIFLKQDNVNPRNLLEVRPEKAANIDLNDYFTFIASKLEELDRAITNIPEGSEN